MSDGPHAEIISPYFLHMKALLVGGLVLGDIEESKLKMVTAKALYEGFTSTLPPPKVVFKFDIDWSKVWERLQSPLLESGARQVLFMVINNVVANRDRLHNKFHMVPSPNCVTCNVLHDNVHLFCECFLVREAWFWVRQRLLGILPNAGRTSNFEFLNLMFDSSPMDGEVLWIMGVYIQLVWDYVICKKKQLKLKTLQSEYQLKFITHKHSRMPDLGYIVGLLD